MFLVVCKVDSVCYLGILGRIENNEGPTSSPYLRGLEFSRFHTLLMLLPPDVDHALQLMSVECLLPF